MAVPDPEPSWVGSSLFRTWSWLEWSRRCGSPPRSTSPASASRFQYPELERRRCTQPNWKWVEILRVKFLVRGGLKMAWDKRKGVQELRHTSRGSDCVGTYVSGVTHFRHWGEEQVLVQLSLRIWKTDTNLWYVTCQIPLGLARSPAYETSIYRWPPMIILNAFGLYSNLVRWVNSE